MLDDLEFVEPHAGLESEPGYVYHATSVENLYDIVREGKLRTFPPWHGTDQDVWPDGSRQRRSYWSRDAGTVWGFMPEQGPWAVLRTRETSSFRRESTGDIYTTKPVLVNRLEVLTPDGWVSLGRAENPTWLAVTGAALTGAVLGAAGTFRGVGGNPAREYTYVELEEYEGSILMFPAEGAQVLGWAVNQVTGKFGYSHCALDVGVVNQEGTPLWIDSWAGEGVALRTPDRFERDPIRIPLSPAEASHARAVALHLLHEGTPYRGRTGGKHCSEFVISCLPRSMIEKYQIPLNATPNEMAVRFGLVDVKQLKKKLLR